MADTAGIIEVDRLSFLVRAQKFKVAATLMKRTSVPLTTEYAVRLVHLIRGITPEELAGFFDFDEPETRILLQDVLSSGLIEEKAGRLQLSARGEAALSSGDDTLNMFDLDEIPAIISLDLIAFAPVSDAELAAREARLVEEVPVSDRIKAANSAATARDAYDLHFQEWRLVQGRRLGLDEDTRLHSMGDAYVVRNFAAPIDVPVRCRLDDVPGAAPDFIELSSKGRTGSRDLLVEALSKRVQRIVGASDHQAAYDLMAEYDGGILRRDGIRSALDQHAWAVLAANIDKQEFTGWVAPGVRLAGSTSTGAIRAALLEWTEGIGGSSQTPVPVFWVPPGLPHWGRSIRFASLAADLSESNSGEDGTVLLARVDGSDAATKAVRRLYGPTDRIPALFDRCLPLDKPPIPDALELIVKPGSWALALIHAPDPQTGFPFPIGYITAAPGIVSRYSHIIAECAAATKGPGALLWQRPGESPDKALLMIDEALGIGVA